MAENRVSRNQETRAATVQPASWVQPDLLPTPTPREGVVFRWVSVATLGQNDPNNISLRMREGWVPERADAHPEMYLIKSEHDRFKDNVVIGGLMLCSAPAELMADRQRQMDKKTNDRMLAVDNELMRENDPRMPLFNQRKTQVRFGNGN